jgi:hypothetical protein
MFTNVCKSFLILTKFYTNKKNIKNIYNKKKENSINKKPFYSNLQLPKIKQDCPSFSLSSIKSIKNAFGNFTNGFISSNCSINKESNNSMRTNIFNIMNVITPNTINDNIIDNYIIKKLIENGNDLYKDLFNNNEIEKSKFKESYNHSFNDRTPCFSVIKDDEYKNYNNINIGKGLINLNNNNNHLNVNLENVNGNGLFNNLINEKEKNSIFDYNNYVNIIRKGNKLTISEKKELIIIVEDDKDDKEDKENINNYYNNDDDIINENYIDDNDNVN